MEHYHQIRKNTGSPSVVFFALDRNFHLLLILPKIPVIWRRKYKVKKGVKNI